MLIYGTEPRGRWPLARVVDLIRGPDGSYRAAFVEVRGARTRRPLSKLFEMEASPE